MKFDWQLIVKPQYKIFIGIRRVVSKMDMRADGWRDMTFLQSVQFMHFVQRTRK
jgi:hypothetical protein